MTRAQSNGIGTPIRERRGTTSLGRDSVDAHQARALPLTDRTRSQRRAGSSPQPARRDLFVSWAYVLGFVLLCGVVGAIGGPS